MKCSNCASINVCRFVGDMKQVAEQSKNILTDGFPFLIAITCKFYNEDKRVKSVSLMSNKYKHKINQHTTGKPYQGFRW